MYNNIKKIFKKFKQKIKHLDSVIKYSKNNVEKNYFIILLDIILCNILYSLNLEEYKQLEFYNVPPAYRNTYLTNFKHNIYIKFICKKEILSIINNKQKFLKRFNKYIKREIKNVNDISFKEFENILLENKKIISRSINSDFKTSYQIHDLSKFRGPGFILEKLKKDKLYLIEKYFSQHKKLNEISNNLVIINIVTMNNSGKIDIISSYITFKENNMLIKGYIDIKKSHIKGHLRDENNEVCEQRIINYEIPFLNKIIDYTKTLAKEIEEIKEVEWSVCVDSKGKIHLMDACPWKDYIFCQTPEYLNKKIGLLPYYKKIILKKRSNFTSLET